MPNWSATNVVLRGDKKEISSFTKLLNKLPSIKPFKECGFGPFWLGYLVHALGGDWQNTPCRGIISPNPEEYACLSCQDPSKDLDDLEFKTLNDGTILRFSVIMAWSLDKKLFSFIKEKYPSFEFFWRTTDEFGNFYEIHDTENLGDWPDYEISIENGEKLNFRKGEEEKAAEFLLLHTGIKISTDEILKRRESLFKKLARWHGKHHEFITFIIWERN